MSRFNVHFTITERETGQVIAKGRALDSRLGLLSLATQGNHCVQFDFTNFTAIDTPMESTIVRFDQWQTNNPKG